MPILPELYAFFLSVDFLYTILKDQKEYVPLHKAERRQMTCFTSVLRNNSGLVCMVNMKERNFSKKEKLATQN